LKNEENRWWIILDYLTTLEEEIKEKANRVAKGLISEQEELEKKKKQKIEQENQ
jgi:hypothetical protein